MNIANKKPRLVLLGATYVENVVHISAPSMDIEVQLLCKREDYKEDHIG